MQHASTGSRAITAPGDDTLAATAGRLFGDDAVIATDAEFVIRFWSDRAAQLYGWTQEEMVGRNVIEAISWGGSVDALRSALADLGSTGRWEGRCAQSHRDGTNLDVWATVTELRDAAGVLCGVVACTRPNSAAPLGTVDPPSLQQTLGAGQLEVHYQPIVAAGTGLLRSVEALVRWVEPDGTRRSPAEILPKVAAAGLLATLDDEVMCTAVSEMARWRLESGRDDVTLHVNVSSEYLLGGALADRVVECCGTAGLPPTELVVEVTEGALIDDLPAAAAVLSELSKLGVRAAIDDFGTGYAGLAWVRSLPVNVLKIDREFVSDIAGTEPSVEDVAIVRSILTLADELHMQVVAEGVETKEQEIALIELGARQLQGYLFGRPAPIQTLGRFVDVGTRSPPEAVPAPIPVDEAERQRDIDRAAVIDDDMQREFESITALAASICGTPMATVTIIDHERAYMLSPLGFAATEFPRDISFCAHTILTPDRPMIVTDALADSRFSLNPNVVDGPGIRFYVGFPLEVSPGRAVGALCVTDTTPRRLSEDQLAALGALSKLVTSQLRLRLTVAELHDAKARHEVVEQELRHLATHDVLTGLANRALFFTELTRQLSKGPAGVVFSDVDSLKAVNDQRGHAAGDTLLVRHAHRLTEIPGAILAARLGGDEFAVLTEADDTSGVAAAVEALGDSSVGWAVGSSTTDPDDLLRTADRRMYDTKRGRRRAKTRTTAAGSTPSLPGMGGVDRPGESA
ncbi:MAG: hypothetical protein NVS3B21_16870 [Acidimicrobiales bacterium]